MSGKTNRKYGRNKKDCEAYKKDGRQEYNKDLKHARHIKAHPGDTAKHSGAVNYKRKAPLDVFEKLFSQKA